VQFFRQIACLKGLPFRMLRDLHLSVEPVKYQLNQVVFQEGAQAEYVVFVRRGAFELTRSFTQPAAAGRSPPRSLPPNSEDRADAAKRKMRQYANVPKQALLPRKSAIKKLSLEEAVRCSSSESDDDKVHEHTSLLVSRQQVAKNSKQIVAKQMAGRLEATHKVKVRLAILTAGQLHGDGDVVLRRHYTTTLRCVERDSEAYLMNKDVFLRLFRGNGDAWKRMFAHAKQRETQILETCHRYVDVAGSDFSVVEA
jgi:CRP-like cAMP-binding protein